MEVLKLIAERAKAVAARIILPEWQDDRVVEAVVQLAQEKIVQPIMVGPKEQILERLRAKGLRDASAIRIIDPNHDERSKDIAFNYYVRRRDHGMGFFEAKQAIANPLLLSALLVHESLADGLVCGATYTTAEVVRAGLKGIGVKPGIAKVSSTVLIVSPHRELGSEGILFFADCAVIPDPDPDELADIALATAQTAQSLLQLTPKIAFLSFSTKGSAKHSKIDKVREAAALAKKRAPELAIDGEMQLDAAVIPSVAKAKAPGSPIAGDANILIFPDLNAANIGYKMAQRFGKAQAVGPILQGFRRPVNDLSRGCSAEDIMHVAAITALQGQA